MKIKCDGIDAQGEVLYKENCSQITFRVLDTNEIAEIEKALAQ